MITVYHRPQSLDEALALLARPQVRTLPLGGGTQLLHSPDQPVEVVDLQALGLAQISTRGSQCQAGAAVRLQQLLEVPDLPSGLRKGLEHEAAYNLRNMRTLVGSLLAADGRSALAVCMLALDTSLRLERQGSPAENLALGNLLPVREETLPGILVTQVSFPLNVWLAYEYVARTPADLPLVCAAAARWPSGRTRLVVGGFGRAPRLALDGPEDGGWEAAVRSACSQAGDAWASAEYRQETAVILAGRALLQQPV